MIRQLILLVACAASLVAAVPADPKLLKLTQANDDFGLALLHELEVAEIAKGEPDNVFISPFSISTVLSMILAGAANTTYTQIYHALGLEHSQLTDADLATNYQALFHDLKQKSSDKKNELEVANSLAVQKDFALKETFMKTLTDAFDSRVFVENFASASHQATDDINKWVMDKTHGKIAKLFDQDLDPSTVLVLLNAIYFKGEWKTQFNKSHTESMTFKGVKSVPVPTMKLEHKFKLAEFEDGQLLELPYVDESLSMLIFLPKENKNVQSRLIQTLSAQLQGPGSVNRGSAKLASRIAQLHSRKVNVLLPRFKVEQKYSLVKPLNGLGMLDAFLDGKADLSRIAGRHDLKVSDILHKTYIEVNEEGSEAAAVTGGVIVVESVEIVDQFVVDRPFLFLIRDNQHDLTLFAGVINKP